MTADLIPADLLDRVVAYFNPKRVILFGSRARGDAAPDSDIDLLVILDNDAPPAKRTLKAGYVSQRGYFRAADVIPVREAVYQKRAQIAGTLALEAEQDGVTVYERP
jgi:predicted nucleotidyltransferase